MGDSPFVYAGFELPALQSANNYYREIANWFRPYLGERIIEVGAGIGTFTEYLLKLANPAEMILLEPAENLFPVLQKRYGGDSRIKVMRGYLENLENSQTASTLILVNVLEHVEDDARLLDAAHRILDQGGALLLFVPALPWLYGTLDEAFDHHRRYSKSQLAEKLLLAGFRLERIRYVNLPGVIAWYLAGKVLRQRTLKPQHVRLYDRWILPWCFRLEKAWEPPFGQSLFAVARK
jgi:SAM-dependent methyltransferase